MSGVFSHVSFLRFPRLRWFQAAILLLLAVTVPAQAQSLTYDVRLGDGGNTKARTVSVGDVLTLQVFGVVTGTDGLNNEGLQFGWGSVLSAGTATSAGGNLSSLTLASPFNGVSSQVGTVQDLNGDGFADVGSTALSQNGDFVFARANGLSTTGTRIGANQEEFLLGTLTYTVTAAGDDTATAINFLKGTFLPVNQRNSLFQVDGGNRNDLNATIGSGNDVLVSFGPSTVYWNGDQNSSWTTDNLGNTNWATDATGNTDAGVLPGNATNVFFNASGAANLTTTLGRDFSIKSLNFTANATAPVTVASGGAGNFKLTLGSGGINVAAGSGAHTISARTVIGASQNWTIDTHPATDFTVSGSIESTSGKILRKQGNGTLKLTGNNTNFLGTLEIYGGTVNAAGTNALGGVNEIKVMGGSLTLGGAGTLDRVRDGAKITLFSNTKLVRLGNVSEGSATATGLGTLSLAGNATVDFGNWGSEIGTLAFADFDPTTFTLTVDNWTAPEFATDPQNYAPSSLTDDRLIFGRQLTESELAKIVFVGFSGARQIDLGNGLWEAIPNEIFTPVPEASTVYICLALLGLVGWRQRHSLRTFGRWFANPEPKDV